MTSSLLTRARPDGPETSALGSLLVPVITEWPSTRVGDLVALADVALPDERLGVDDLLACCWEDPGVVLGADDGSGAVSVVVRSFGEHHLAWIKLIAVEPAARRHGHGARLLAAAERWAFDRQAREVDLGGSAPWYLWPGVDT